MTPTTQKSGLRRRMVLLALCIGTGAACAQQPNADYPAKPVQITLGFAAGSSVDFAARLIGDKLRERWGKPVLIDNRPGAGGNIAAGLVAKAPADGYTLLLGTNALAIGPAIYRELSYDARRDLTAVAQVTSMPHILLANKTLPAANAQEFIALARKDPGRFNFASAGVGDGSHLAGEMFRTLAGIEILHVPYKGGQQIMTDLVGGAADVSFAGAPISIQMVQAGRLKALATTGRHRSAALPNVPTVAESGLKGYEYDAWYGLFAPRGTPAVVVQRIAADAAAVLADADTRRKLQQAGLEPTPSSPADFDRFFAGEYQRWGDRARQLQITPN